MPRLSAWFVRASLLYLATGFTLGALMLANKGFQLSPMIWRLLPVHVEVLLVGWIVQLVLGMAFWILPRFRSFRGDVRPAWAAFGLLNAGLLLLAAGALLNGPSWTALAGRLAEVAGVVAFALHAWPRVKSIGQ